MEDKGWLTWQRLAPYLVGVELCAFVHLAEVDSTNDHARRLASDASFIPPGGFAAVIAEKQTKGKGRSGRAWATVPGKSVALSIAARPKAGAGKASAVTLAAACAVSRAVESSCGVAAMIKWPNDIVVGGKKICGILAETLREPGRADLLIVGIGINANLDEQDIPPELREEATSLKLAAGAAVDRNRLAADVLRAFLSDYAVFMRDRFSFGSPLREYYCERCVNIGREVIATQGGEELRAVCSGISEDGGLIVELPGGGIRELISGEVSVRGADGYA